MSPVRKLFLIVSSISILFLTGINFHAFAQKASTRLAKPDSAATALGQGLAHFDFLYAGEAKVQNMYIIRKGKVVWSYQDSLSGGEISDAIRLKNGNILFAHQFGITLINADKKVIWRYKTPRGCETHTAQPIGKDHVVFIQNGDSAKLFVVNIVTGKTVKVFGLPTKNPKSVHGQFRHARLTQNGTILVAHMDLGKVCEYNIDGKELWSLMVPSVWSAKPLANGNILVTSNLGFVRELNRKGDVIWEYLVNEIPEYNITSPQIAIRLANGNTLINNWFNEWNGKVDLKNPPVQAIEVTSDKKIVWVLQSWENPNLGPSTTIQLLNETAVPENVFFGNIH